MSYTAITLCAVVLAVVLDRWVLGTRLTSTRDWWCTYAIIAFFQLLTNGWLTGRRIVTYDPGTILGDGSIPFIGDGRIVFAPVEDLGFGFALVLVACAVWVRLGSRTTHALRERQDAS